MSGAEYPDGRKDLAAIERGDHVAIVFAGVVAWRGRLAYVDGAWVGIREATWIGWPEEPGAYVETRMDEVPAGCIALPRQLSAEQREAFNRLGMPRPLSTRWRAP